ncbi:SPOR domain-containing protein [Tepidiphilus olei]|uniref:SPOR domain-containing protein n=1 Tax=Tepidiphilus olei TaxID=2502184 RepID=UPI00115CED86|nr:SPOR domain-containing protein [Tepidiphilus olei]
MSKAEEDSRVFPWKRVLLALLIATAAAYGLWYKMRDPPRPAAGTQEAPAQMQAQSQPVGQEDNDPAPNDRWQGAASREDATTHRSPLENHPPTVASEDPIVAQDAPPPEPVAPTSKADTSGQNAPAKAMTTHPAGEKTEEPPFIDRSKPLDKGYYVPIGVFGRMDNAMALAGRVQEQGFPSHLQARVLVGPYASRQEALEAAKQLKRHEIEVGAVTQVK